MKTDYPERTKSKAVPRKLKPIKSSDRKRMALKKESISQIINRQSQEIAHLKQRMNLLKPSPRSPTKKSEMSNTPELNRSTFNEINQQLHTQLEFLQQHISAVKQQPNGYLPNANANEPEIKHWNQIYSNIIDDMKMKLNLLHQKFFENRDTNTELQHQLKLALTCMQREFGENLNFNTIASNSGFTDWQGRAREIVYLQQKLDILKKRLNLKSTEQQAGKPIATTKRRARDSNDKLAASGDGTHMSTRNGDKKTPRERHVLRKTSNSGASGDTTTTTTTTTTTGNNNGHSSRSEKFTSKSTSRTESCSQQMEMPDQSFIVKLQKVRAAQQAKMSAFESEISTLKSKLDEQNNRMVMLKKHNTLLKHELEMKKSAEKLCNNSSPPAVQQKKYNAQQLQVELVRAHQRMHDMKRQYEQKLKSNAKLESKIQQLQTQLSEKDQTIERLNRSVEHLEEDLRAVSGDFLFACRELRKEEFIAILNSLDSEKKDLLEYNKTLNGRIKKERQENEALSKALAEQKLHIIHMEAKVGELASQLSLADSGTCSNENTIHHMKGAIQNRYNEMVQEVESMRENITVLEHRIRCLSEEKENDVRNFEQIVDNTKAILLDSIFSLRGVCCTHENVSNVSIVDT